MELSSVYNWVVDALVYLAIAVYFLKAKDNSERFHLIVVLAGFFALDGMIGDVFLSRLFIAGWLVLTDTPIMIPKTWVVAFMAVSFFIQVYSPAFLLIGTILYVIVLWGFLWGAVKKATGMTQ